MRYLALSGVLCLAAARIAAEPLRIHPENPKYFLFRGKPLVLVTATEHYGSVINRPFDFENYLDNAAAMKMTLTRTFLLFREQQSSRNPSSPCKPESPDYIAPFPRTGPGKALDGEPVYDLDQWNPEYFGRLHRFLTKASEKGVVVELTLLSNTYSDGVWALNPLRARNNRQGIGNIEWPEYTSLKDSALVARQLAFARKIVQETSGFDNIYYEIANEPGGGVQNHVSPAEVDAWQEEIARAVRDELSKAGRKILIAGQEAFSYTPRHTFPQDKGLGGSLLDIVNVHPLPNTVFAGRVYELGNFMSKELMLSQMRDFCRAVYARPKPVVHDEDNTASLYRDPTGWTIHRKRAWTALLNGAHYDYIDFSVTVGNETGTPASNQGIRSWMKHLSEFIQSFDVIHAKPLDWITTAAGPLVVSALAVEGRDYVAYLADSREAGDRRLGDPLAGKLSLILPAGHFAVSLYSPVTGLYSPAMRVEGGRQVTLELAPFSHDLAVRAVALPQ
jgi:uncharacterized protein DUF6298